MKNSREAFARLIKCINVKHYIGVNGCKLIEDACNRETEAEKRPPSYTAPKVKLDAKSKVMRKLTDANLPTEAEVDADLFENED